MKAALCVLALLVAMAGCTGVEDQPVKETEEEDDATPPPRPTSPNAGGYTPGHSGVPGSKDQPAEDELRILMDDLAFEPQEVWIKADAMLIFDNNDDVVHTATADGGAFDTGDVQPEGEVEAMAELGDHTYSCKYHRDMTGIVHVVE